MVGCPDNTQLRELDLTSIVSNLETRYAADEIYTSTANVLLSVNPYKVIPGLYSSTTQAKYRGKPQGSQPPHPFAIADAAYRSLLSERRSQSILISGESGAGKTETAKVLIEFLASAAKDQHIYKRVLQTTPILESFGNAQTVRNHNSSRFGKYHRLWFDESNALVGAEVQPFLLESSRVTTVAPGDRNFHVF